MGSSNLKEWLHFFLTSQIRTEKPVSTCQPSYFFMQDFFKAQKTHQSNTVAHFSITIIFSLS